MRRSVIARLFARWADGSLGRENERLRREVDRLREEREQAHSRLRVQSLELDELAAVIARNIKRVEAETAAAAHRIASAERE